MNFIKKLFPTKESKLILFELESLNSYFKTKYSNSLEFTNAWEYVYINIQKNIRNSDTLSKEVRDNNKITQNIILNLVTVFTYEQLSSGNHHFYRGVLNIRGKCLKDIFHKAISKLKDIGVYSDEEFEDLKQELDDNIKFVG